MQCLYHLAIKNTNTHPHIDWDQIVRAEVNADSMLHDNSFPLRVDLPSIVSSSSSAVRRTPFQVAPQTVTAVVHCASPTATVSVYCQQFLCQPFFIKEENENILRARAHTHTHT